VRSVYARAGVPRCGYSSSPTECAYPLPDGRAVQQVVLFSRPGTPLHDDLCTAFLALAGWVTVDAAFYEIITMTDGWGPGARYTRWLLRPAPAGKA
jgi:hypothetical protein